jgi:type I restriction enzyme S subunit
LAVRGKLVEQDPGDEPAAALLQRIGSTAKPRFCADGLADGSNQPFDIPVGWVWVKVPRVLTKLTDGTHHSPANGPVGEFKYVTAKNIKHDGVLLDEMTYVTKEVHQEIYARCDPAFGDILYIKDGATTGTATINQLREPFSMLSSVALLKPSKAVFNRYLLWAMRSPFFYDETRGAMKGAAITRVTLSVMAMSLLPLPPLAEQKRIVEKVDELMKRCDELEARQKERNERRTALTASCLHALTACARMEGEAVPSRSLAPNRSLEGEPVVSRRRASGSAQLRPPSPNTDHHAWQRVCSHFPLLIDTPESVTELRKTILQLAVQGRLVPQDPGDEPVTIALSASGHDIKYLAVDQDKQRHVIPRSWVWMRFAGVGEQRLGKMLDFSKNQGELKPYLRNTNVQWMRFELGDVKEMRLGGKDQDQLRLRYGDLLICEGGEPGRCAIWHEEASEMYFQKAIHRVRPCPSILPEFLAINLRVDCQNDVLATYFTGATIKHFTGRSLSQYTVPIPPLAEQKRIVAKVNELMVLCDDLDAKLTQSRQEAEKLVGAVVRHCAV